MHIFNQLENFASTLFDATKYKCMKYESIFIVCVPTHEEWKKNETKNKRLRQSSSGSVDWLLLLLYMRCQGKWLPTRSWAMNHVWSIYTSWKRKIFWQWIGTEINYIGKVFLLLGWPGDRKIPIWIEAKRFFSICMRLCVQRISIIDSNTITKFCVQNWSYMQHECHLFAVSHPCHNRETLENVGANGTQNDFQWLCCFSSKSNAKQNTGHAARARGSKSEWETEPEYENNFRLNSINVNAKCVFMKIGLCYSLFGIVRDRNWVCVLGGRGEQGQRLLMTIFHFPFEFRSQTVELARGELIATALMMIPFV